MAQRTKELAGNHNCFGCVASADRRATLIIGAVVGSNIHWQWTPNPYLASGIGALLPHGRSWFARSSPSSCRRLHPVHRSRCPENGFSPYSGRVNSWRAPSGLTRTGRQCQSPVVKGRKRCRMDGGAPGSGAPSGERNANYRHGFYTAEAIAERKATRAWLRAL